MISIVRSRIDSPDEPVEHDSTGVADYPRREISGDGGWNCGTKVD